MTATLRIGFILIPGYSLMSMAAAVEPLRAANLLAGRALYDPRYLSPAGGFAASTSGGGFQTAPLAQAGPLDLALIVAGGNPIQYHDAGLLRGLRALAARRVALGGISGGAAILARAGMMEGRRFTLHWAHIDALSELMPDLLIERALYVIDRDRFTCAGGVAALDMMCALIARDRMITGAIQRPAGKLVGGPQRLDRGGQRHQRIVRRQDEPDAQRLIRHAAPASQKPCACPLQANSCPLKANDTRNLAYLSWEERRIGVLAP